MRKTALALVLILLLSLCSCTTAQNYPITVNGTGINEEIFRYFLDTAISDNPEADRDEIIEIVTEKCIRYVALNTTFELHSLSLAPAEEYAVSEKVNALWDVFGAYYQNAGVSKETFLKIHLNEAYTEKLRLFYFDTDGATPFPEEDLKAYFSENYVAFKLIKGYLYTSDVYGNMIEYTPEEQSVIYERYEHAVQQIKKGTSIEIMYASLAETDQIVEQTLNTQVITQGDLHYPAGFYEAVLGIEEGQAGVCLFDDYIYLLYRVELLGTDELFENYRYECLKILTEEPLQRQINIMCNEYTAIRHTKLIQKCYKDILEVRENG